MNEYKSTYAHFAKKDGTTYLTKDLGELIYDNKDIDQTIFVESHQSEMLSSVIAVVGKGPKQILFDATYEKVVASAAVPKSATRLRIVEDKDGNSLYVITVFKAHIDQYI